MLSTCRVLVQNLNESEFNVPVSETARLDIIFLSSLLEREMTPPQKVMGLFVGAPWPEIIMKHSVYIQVQAVRLSLGSRKVDLAGTKKQRIVTLPAGPS